MDEWECMLSDIFEGVLRCLSCEDIKQCRLVCTSWQKDMDRLISRMVIKSGAHIPQMVSTFQASPSSSLQRAFSCG